MCLFFDIILHILSFLTPKTCLGDFIRMLNSLLIRKHNDFNFISLFRCYLSNDSLFAAVRESASCIGSVGFSLLAFLFHYFLLQRLYHRREHHRSTQILYLYRLSESDTNISNISAGHCAALFLCEHIPQLKPTRVQ